MPRVTHHLPLGTWRVTRGMSGGSFAAMLRPALTRPTKLPRWHYITSAAVRASNRHASVDSVGWVRAAPMRRIFVGADAARNPPSAPRHMAGYARDERRELCRNAAAGANPPYEAASLALHHLGCRAGEQPARKCGFRRVGSRGPCAPDLRRR